eukprot:CAMPEP_0119545588 /NCGR_PEP_ID=MMETSP1352-20130426/294_1 /TAXON_ID=265584 /ORGANISM="Stauroneis constricta, Strain CCMP1120" /LENGTH=215 /DNA_ID=CAMNT_0007590155 /DNA_START=50 /DNA_END=697 /DNA_ORIENTATION=+
MNSTMIQSPVLLSAHHTNEMMMMGRRVVGGRSAALSGLGVNGTAPRAPFLTRRTMDKDVAGGLLSDLPRFSAPSMMAKTPTSQLISTRAAPTFRLSLAPRISHERQQPQDQQQDETSALFASGGLLERLRNRRSQELAQQQQQQPQPRLVHDDDENDGSNNDADSQQQRRTSRKRRSSQALDGSNHHQKAQANSSRAIGEGKMQQRPSGGMARSA